MELFVQCVSGICAVEYVSKGCNKIMTNGEWLRSLTDKKIVEILCHYNGECNICAYNDLYYKDSCVNDDSLTCDDGILKWLKEKHKDNYAL